MPRGAIAKRSAKPGAPGPPGPSGLGVLAFPDIATMAAFPMAPYVDGVDAHVLTLDDMWSYDPGSTLAPDVTAYAPLGITIVSANGPGNWTRRQETSRRWRDRNAWFVDPVGGDDEDDGLTAGTALGTFAEFMRRVEGLPAGSVAGGGYDVEILSDLTEVVVIDTNHVSGAQALYIHADPILLFAGVITAHVDYNDATQTVGTITVAGLPVSFTASGLVGKLVRMPGGGGATAIEFWIMQDMGAKTARISPPQAGVFTTAVATVTNTAFEVYDLIQFGSTVSVLDTGGESAQVDFETLELGGAAADSHAVEFKRGGQLIESCTVHGTDTANSQPFFYNCQFVSDLRADGAARIVVANGYLAPGGGGPTARAGSILDFTRVVSYNGWLVQQNGLSRCVQADGWAASLGVTGVGSAFTVAGGGLLALSVDGPGRIWAVDMGAGGIGLNVLTGGTAIYDNAKPPLFTAPTTAVSLGSGLTKTLAQLPYTDPITRAAVLNATPPDAIEDYFVALAADLTIAVAAFTILVTQNITVNGLRDVLFDATFSGTVVGAGGQIRVGLFIDGVQVIGACPAFDPAGVADIGSCSMRWRAALAAGAHVITVRWRCTVGNAYCRPVSEPEYESCTLTVRELYG